MEIATTAGAALVGGVFVWSGVEHLVKFEVLTRHLAGRIVAPAFQLAIASILEIIAGICLGIGYARLYAAAFLIVFTIAATILMLDFWHHSGPQRDSLRSAFLINIAVVGGLILAGGL